jgi:saccharopine dehydrogenase-like NADP-dependent oxidoreductase
MATAGRNFIVLGGYGAIGRVVVRDLFESHRHNRITVADYRPMQLIRSSRVRTVFADAAKPAMLKKLFHGHSVVINCTQHDFNLHVMRAALPADVHYIDLGGLFHWTRQQLKLDRQFQRAGLTAILGIGCAPGITNVMTRAAVEKLDRAESVQIRVGSRDFNPSPGFPYSAQTIREELTLTPWIVERGKFREVKPRTGWELVKFPAPVGPQWVVRARHSEVATLPITFKLKQCDFKVGFDRQFVRDVLGGRIPNRPAARGKPDDYEIARVIVTGRGHKGAPTRIVLDCHARAKPEWHASAGDIDTGCPPSIVAQMLVTGMITQRGVLPPEVAVPVKPFFDELRKRGMRIVERRMRNVETLKS